MDTDQYHLLAEAFVESNGMVVEDQPSPEEIMSQLEVVDEEMAELEEEIDLLRRSGWSATDELVEEMADVVVTLFVLAEMCRLDLGEAYHEKMMYNLKKSGKRDENGKIIDDVE